jgi:uncharacterized RDD family membrane protein YckC
VSGVTGQPGSPAGLPRRLGSMLYDSLLVFALMCIGTVPFVIAFHGETVPANFPPHQATMLAIAYFFFVGFWSYRGRTLGMQSWGLRLETMDGGRPSWRQSSIRFGLAIVSLLPLGLGFWWQLWDSDHLAWHDRGSGTRLAYYARSTD